MISDFQKQLLGHRLATIEVLYYMPDHPSLLQSYIWQTLDIAPHFPRLTRFLDYWKANIEARLHSVKLSTVDTVHASDFRHHDTEFLLH